jgi:hypothetical protein
MDLVVFLSLFSIFIVFIAISLASDSKVYGLFASFWLMLVALMTLTQKISFEGVEIVGGFDVMSFSTVVFLFLLSVSLFTLFSNGLDLI